MSARDEDAIHEHPDVREAAAIGGRIAARAVVKAFVVAERAGEEAFAREIQDLVRSQRLSQQEYPRLSRVCRQCPRIRDRQGQRKILRTKETLMSASINPNAVYEDHREGRMTRTPAHRVQDRSERRAMVPRGTRETSAITPTASRRQIRCGCVPNMPERPSSADVMPCRASW